MIKNIFLPEKFGSYYLFKKSILGIEITKTSIRISKLIVSGFNIIIDKAEEKEIEIASGESFEESVKRTLEILMPTFGKYNDIHFALSSSHVIFKELTLPFTERDVIEKVINLEIEPLLPFSAVDASINFIITNTNKEEKTSTVLAAVCQKQKIEKQLALFKDVGINVDVITVDLIALYGLYTQLPLEQRPAGNHLLVDFGVQSTKIAFIENGQLRFIRSFSIGIATIAKELAENLNVSATEIMQDLLRFGLQKDEPAYIQALEKALTAFFNKLLFTVTSFTGQGSSKPSVDFIYLIGSGTEISGILGFVSKKLFISCENFNGNKLAKINAVKINTPHAIANTNIMSIAAAFPTKITESFNLITGDFRVLNIVGLIKQLVTALILIIILFASLITHMTIQKNRLQNEIKVSTQEALTELKERFKQIDEDETNLDDAIEAAKLALKKEEETWYAFSKQARGSLLKYLLELTSRIDMQGLGFSIEKLSIGEGTMTLQARVRDYEALKKLEQELRQSKLFSYVEPQNDPDFTMTIQLINSRNK